MFDEIIGKKLATRILNWKFETALIYISGAKTDEGKEIIKQLAKTYKDIGWKGSDSAKVSDVVCDELERLFVLEPHLDTE